MNNISKKEICIKNLENEFQYYKKNRKRFELKKFTLTFMEFVIEYVKQFEGDCDVFDDLIYVPNLLLNLTYNICDIDDVDDVLFENICKYCYQKRGLKSIDFIDEDDDDEYWDDEEEEDDEFQEDVTEQPKEKVHDNEDC